MIAFTRLSKVWLLSTALLAVSAAAAHAQPADAPGEVPGPATAPLTGSPPGAQQGAEEPNATAPAQSAPTVVPESPNQSATVPSEQQRSAALPPSSTSEPSAEPQASSVTADKNVDLHGGVYLWLYEPLDVAGTKNSLDIYFAHLLFDAKLGEFGVHFEPRFRDKKLREFFAGNVWIQEAYVYWKRDSIAVKVGKQYSHFGRFWDNSFYGNLPYFDGLKLSPEQGISIEGSTTADKVGPRLNFAAQYFLIDGLTNGAYRGGDTLFDPGSRRRNIAVANVEPAYQFSDDASLGLDVSGEYFQADLADVGKKNVYRLALGANGKFGSVSAFGEYTYQRGQHVKDFPVPATPGTATTPGVPGQASSHNHYVWAGAEFAMDKFSARYNFSFVSYADVSVRETIHEPGVGYALNKNISLLTEFVLWQTRAGTPKHTSVYDRSLNFVIYGSF